MKMIIKKGDLYSPHNSQQESKDLKSYFFFFVFYFPYSLIPNKLRGSYVI